MKQQFINLLRYDLLKYVFFVLICWGGLIILYSDYGYFPPKWIQYLAMGFLVFGFALCFSIFLFYSDPQYYFALRAIGVFPTIIMLFLGVDTILRFEGMEKILPFLYLYLFVLLFVLIFIYMRKINDEELQQKIIRYYDAIDIEQKPSSQTIISTFMELTKAKKENSKYENLIRFLPLILILFSRSFSSDLAFTLLLVNFFLLQVVMIDFVAPGCNFIFIRRVLAHEREVISGK